MTTSDAPYISDLAPSIRRIVYRADKFRCVFCRSRALLQVDHVCPRAAGGASRLRNYVTLCRRCNKTKSDFWPGHTYHPFDGLDDPAKAAAILRCELWARRNPLRWMRLAMGTVEQLSLVG